MGIGNRLGKIFGRGSCHDVEGPEAAAEEGMRRIVLVGTPNVGKSVVFNRLTGVYAQVSNYPGTTVEISRGSIVIGGKRVQVIDTPGMYSLLPITEEERVARTLLMSEHPHCVLHVVDAKNLERMLPLTLQLIEAGLPVVLVLNMMDEADAAGITVDVKTLGDRLGVPAVPTVATTGYGIDVLRERLSEYVAGQCAAN
jgi:ferrous iron transport protein B